MTQETENKALMIKVLNRIALVSGIFSAILCILIIATFIQVSVTDPINTPAKEVLLQQIHENPQDAGLKEAFRELDLVARKAYFTSQWQLRTGGYLLLVLVGFVLISLKWIDLIRTRHPELPNPKPPDWWAYREVNRRWIAITGSILIAGSLGMAFLTYRNLGNQFGEAGEKIQQKLDSLAVEDNNLLNEPQVAIVSVTDNTTVKTDSIQGEQDSPEAKREMVDSTQSKPVEPSRPAYLSNREIMRNSVTFRGPYGNGVVMQRGFPIHWDGTTGKNIRWKTAIPLPGKNSTIVYDGMVFLSGASESKRAVYALDAQTGKIVWQTDVSQVQGTPDGVPKTDRETGLAASTMTTDGHRVYAIFATGDLVALDFEGKVVWSKNLGMPQNHYGHSSSLIMYRTLLLVQWDQSNVAEIKAFEGKTGELIWNTPREVRVSWASPVLVNTGNRQELILSADPYVAAYNPASGKELWRLDCIYGEVGPSVAYADGMVFVTNEYATLAAIKLGNPPEVAWEQGDYLSDIPSPVANEKYLFLVTSYGAMVCYDAKTGKEYWVHEFENATYASPMLVGDLVYQLDKAGLMHIFKADSVYESVAVSPLGEGSDCTPAFANEAIYIRGDQHVTCIAK
jgi:outer membrane protein assembly factor BamB